MYRCFVALALSLCAVSAAQASEVGDVYVVAGATKFDYAVPEASGDTRATLGVGYQFSDNLAVELTAPVQAFESNVDQAGFGTLIQARYRPYNASVLFQFAPDRMFSPYLGLGYAYTDTSLRAVGPLAGTKLEARENAGFSVRAGVDYNIAPQWFARADVSRIESDLVIDATVPGGPTGKIVDEPMHSTFYSLFVGYRF